MKFAILHALVFSIRPIFDVLYVLLKKPIRDGMQLSLEAVVAESRPKQTTTDCTEFEIITSIRRWKSIYCSCYFATSFTLFGLANRLYQI